MFANGFTAETRADRSSLDLPGTAVRAKALGSARRGGRSAAVLDRRRAVAICLSHRPRCDGGTAVAAIASMRARCR